MYRLLHTCEQTHTQTGNDQLQEVASPVSSTIRKAVGAVPSGNGLAIIISNDYNGTEMPVLTETHKDGEKMANVFQGLKYAVAHFTNVKHVELYRLLHEATQLLRYPKTYRCIVLVFTGHGSCDRYSLFTQDVQKVSIMDIITQFMPNSSPFTALLPKVFVLNTILSEKDKDVVTVPKELGSIPTFGNYIVAHRLYETKDSSGTWINLLAENIQQRQNESVADIFTTVNSEVVNLYQGTRYNEAMTHAETWSRLDHFLSFVPPKESQADRPRHLSSEPIGEILNFIFLICTD